MASKLLKEYPPYIFPVNDVEELQIYIDAIEQNKTVEGCIVVAIELNSVKDDTTHLATVTLQEIWHG